MKTTRREFALGGAAMAATAALGAPRIARAESYPSKPVTYVVGYNPGGESDVTARMQQEYFREITGQQLVILNKPGAGGATAWAQLNGFEPDGHTVMGTIVPHIVLQPAMKTVGYVTDDIENVYFFHYTPDAVVVRADSPYQTLSDFIAAAKAAPGAVTVGGSGTNSANHLAATLLKGETGAVTTYIPFKGSAPAMTALLGGQISAAMSYTTQGVKAGDQVRVLAVATEARHPALPNAPTFKEAGVDYVGGAYRGVAVPKGAPEAVRRRLSEVIGEINRNPGFVRRMTEAGYSVVDIPVDAAPDFIAERRAAYAAAIEALKAG